MACITGSINFDKIGLGNGTLNLIFDKCYPNAIKGERKSFYGYSNPLDIYESRLKNNYNFDGNILDSKLEEIENDPIFRYETGSQDSVLLNGYFSVKIAAVRSNENKKYLDISEIVDFYINIPLKFYVEEKYTSSLQNIFPNYTASYNYKFTLNDAYLISFEDFFRNIHKLTEWEKFKYYYDNKSPSVKVKSYKVVKFKFKASEYEEYEDYKGYANKKQSEIINEFNSINFSTFKYSTFLYYTSGSNVIDKEIFNYEDLYYKDTETNKYKLKDIRFEKCSIDIVEKEIKLYLKYNDI